MTPSALLRPALLRHLRLWLAGLATLLLAAVVQAEPGCRIAFDLGSTGIRAGASGESRTAKSNLDFLGFIWSATPLTEIVAPTAEALQQLPARAGFASDCQRVGGGFSFWRLALEHDPTALIAALAEIRQRSGTAILVIPPEREGAYGYFAARRTLPQLATSHILDIGGGSLEIAGADSGIGEPYGQRSWSRLLCQELRAGAQAGCPLLPLSAIDLARARALADAKLQRATALPKPVTLTAISRPVSRGLLPALQRLDLAPTPERIALPALTQAIATLAPRTLPEVASLTGTAPEHAAYLVSDLLLAESVLRLTGASELQIAESDLTNLPGLLADDRAYQWAERYACYLQRLNTSGLAAFASDPASCEK